MYGNIEASVDCLKSSNISGFHDIKWHKVSNKPQISTKILTKKEFEENLLGTFQYKDKRSECSNYFLINNHITFEIFKSNLG